MVKRWVEVFALTRLYLTKWQKYIVYKTGSGLGPQSVRKSSIIEVRVIDCIIRTPPPPLGWSFFELADGGVWDLIIAGHLVADKKNRSLVLHGSAPQRSVPCDEVPCVLYSYHTYISCHA